MAHNVPCERAARPACKCSGCGGSRHGWPGYLKRAAGEPALIDEFRKAADLEWLRAQESFRRSGREEPTKKLQRATVDIAIADVLTWLAQQQTDTKRLEELGDGIHEEVFAKKLRAHADEHKQDDPGFAHYGKEITGHFWCDLLTELADAANRADSYLDKVPEEARKVLFEGEDPPEEWGTVKEALASVALKAVWTLTKQLVGADLVALVRLLRVLALLICPDPGDHGRITRLCLTSLAGDVLAEETTDRLRNVFAPRPDAT